MNFQQAEFYCSYGVISQIPKVEEGAPAVKEFVFSGRSNVGKSTLINKVLNRKSLARVSSMPGKTTTINFYKLEDIYLVDLPGYGYAKRSQGEKERWRQLMEGYFGSNGCKRSNIEMVFQLIDMRHPPTADDLDMLTYLEGMGYPYTLILTKSDKLSKKERSERLELLPLELEKRDLHIFDGTESRIVEFSGTTGVGVDSLRGVIEFLSGNDVEVAI